MNEKNQFASPYWLLNHKEDKKVRFIIVLMSTTWKPEKGIQVVKKKMAEDHIAIDSISVMSDNPFAEIAVTIATKKAWSLFQKFLPIMHKTGFDVAVVPRSGRKKNLLVCDMDSTIVQSETLNDIAKQVGIGKQISEITDRAMRGEIDFRQALIERVGLLADVKEVVIRKIANSIRLSSGAEKLLASAKKHGIRSVLVSGGFETIVKKVADKLGFDRYVCNQLELVNDQLTGKVLEPIIDEKMKRNILLEECQQLGIKPELACSIGDGANDIAMLQAAGLGIGFQAKPLVQASTPYQINKTDLESVLYIMGIHA